ncbi:PEP-CTERM sorting domain-containing protein [Uliginosibacterium sp. H3]|uniref:PEP-CTERM sorting domain-containing protein n=1 Tax=Uliginosibacterium silvisoli TaxID=3114758 RepID=A0ABU6K1J1_9RHOO|nr:PEP-CTERM sorting domain-containing protein [Uliginosibacterium sp. H3]
MLKKLLSTLAALLALGAGSANAIVLTLDDANLTVIRPLSGSASASFSGSYTLTPGFEFISLGIDIPYTAGGEGLDDSSPSTTFTPGAFVFTFTILPTDTLGLYDTYLRGGLSMISAGECAVGGGICNNSSSIPFSITIVEGGEGDGNRIPEPGSLALAFLGLGGLLIARRRRLQ